MNSVRLAIVFYIFGAATAVLLWRNSANPDALHRLELGRN